MKIPTAEDVQAACTMIRVLAEHDHDKEDLIRLVERCKGVFRPWLAQFEDDEEEV